MDERAALVRRLLEARGVRPVAGLGPVPLDAAIDESITLAAAGPLPPIHAAAIGYLPRRGSGDAGAPEPSGEVPSISGVVQTPLGTVTLITLPHTADDLDGGHGRFLDSTVRAVRLAGAMGARATVLRGRLPSLTGFGHDVIARVPPAEGVAVSTASATLVAAVVLAVERATEETGRLLEEERLALWGYGNFSLAILDLMLTCLPHPRAIAVRAFKSSPQAAEQVRAVTRRAGFRGHLEIFERDRARHDLDDSTLVVAAAHTEAPLDLARLRPGTIVIEDYPTRGVPAAAGRGASADGAGDVLVTDGARLRFPRVVTELRIPSAATGSTLQRRPDELTACVVSALLSACQGAPRSVGPIVPDDVRQHYRLLKRLGFIGGELGAGRSGRSFLERFRTRFRVAAAAGRPSRTPEP